MKPRRDNAATADSTAKQKREKEKGRFQIVKLEERIAPNRGGVPHNSDHPKCNVGGCSG